MEPVKVKQILKIVQDGSIYIFTAPRLEFNEFLKIGDVVLEWGTVYTVETLPDLTVWRQIRVKQQAIASNGELPNLSIKEYEDRELELLRGQNRDGDGNPCGWKSLEAEYEYKKFKRDYEFLYDVQTLPAYKLEYSLEDLIPADNPFIIPFRHLGKEITNQKALYKRMDFWISSISAIMEKTNYVASKSTSAPGTYSFYHYKKGELSLYIEGQLVISESSLHDVSDSYGVVKTILENDLRSIQERISLFENARMKEVNLSEVIDLLKSLQGKVRGLPVKVSGTEKLSSLNSFIRERIAHFEKIALKKDQEDASEKCDDNGN